MYMWYVMLLPGWPWNRFELTHDGQLCCTLVALGVGGGQCRPGRNEAIQMPVKTAICWLF